MKRKNKTACVIRRMLTLAMAVLSLALLLPVQTFAEETTTTPYSLTVLPVNQTDTETAADLTTAEIYVDLYQVANVTMDGTGRFDLALTDSFSSLKVSVEDSTEEGLIEIGDFTELTSTQKITTATWEKLAQDAAKLIQGAGSSTSPAAVTTLSVGKAAAGESLPAQATNMAPGLYLLIARTEAADYWKTIAVKNADGTKTGENLVSVVKSASKSYYYLPTLITVPYKAPDENEVISTDSAQPWINAVTAVLKPMPDELRGKIKITKTLNGYVGPDKAQFVFEISGTGPDNKSLPSKIVSLQFAGNGTKETVEIEFPVGSTLKVEEVYNGSRYALTTAQTVDGLVITAEEVAEAKFTNTHDDTNTGGYGIVNNYRLEKDSTGGLKWSEATQLPDNSQAPQQ